MPMTLRDEYSHNQKLKLSRWKNFEFLHETVKIFIFIYFITFEMIVPFFQPAHCLMKN